MDRNPIDIASIIAKKFKNEPTTVEQERCLLQWKEEHPENAQLYDRLVDADADFDSNFFDQIDRDSAWLKVREKQQSKSRWKVAAWSAAAAAIILIVSVLGYVNTGAPVSTRIVQSSNPQYKNDLLPAHLGAKIILADGQQIDVDDTLNVQNSAHLAATENTQTGTEVATAVVYNTLDVPAANYFKIILEDGTAVWVNSKSQLRFPSRFAQTERKVYLSGEAYFEVAKDTARPFFVETNDFKIRVVGTHFNVASIGGRSKATLAEGKIEVSQNEHTVSVMPGQSVEWKDGGFKISEADLQKDLAWKNNEFYFKKDNIIRIAQQLQSWYDLEVVLSDEVSLTETYTGGIARNVRLSEVLNMLGFVSDLDFKIDQNKLLITKK